MQLLNPLDAAFLALESREHPMHVGALQLFDIDTDNGPSSVSELCNDITAITDVQPRFRRRPSRAFGGFSNLSWNHSDEVDLDYHLTRIAVADPGGMQQLRSVVSGLHSALLDRHRPLWQSYLIEGLADGRLALYTKTHHALMDGVSAIRLMQRTLDEDPDPTRLGVMWGAARPRATGEGSSARGRRQRRGLPTPASLVAGALDSARLLLAKELPRPMSAPVTMFNVPIGGARSIAFRSWPLERIRAVQKVTETTVNDVVLAMCAAALRAYLAERAALPDAPLVALVPVSLRPGDNGDADGNGVGAALCDLATHFADPVDRLFRIADSMRQNKALFGRLPTSLALALSGLAMAPIAAFAVRGYPPLPRAPFNVAISNVAGPQTPMYLGGARLDALYPLSLPLEGQALNITVTSNASNLDFGLVACRRAVPDLDRLLVHLDDGLAELEKATADCGNSPAAGGTGASD
ncbi:wax ester/triacylglycerol synthase family O-acyltransferase [Nocardia asteroides]|uniref:WS/DGAT/MGAT family O-acyltransferase n=1 Tax=Nocardia asteroides TaxID=1824 RepID=UPI00343D714C